MMSHPYDQRIERDLFTRSRPCATIRRLVFAALAVTAGAAFFFAFAF